MRSHIKPIFLTILAFALPGLLKAASAVPADSHAYSPVMIGLVSLVIILLFAILVLGNILRQLGFVYRDKLREKRNNEGVITKGLGVLAVLLAISGTVSAQAQAGTNSGSMAGISSSDFYMLMGLVAVELMVIMVLSFQVRKLVKLIADAPEPEHKALPKFKPSFWDKMNDAVAVEKEADILLDHDYDGIKELDNSLPPWWKYGFYVTIVVAIVYFWYYQIGSGPSSYDEYVAEVTAGEEAKAAYLAKAANLVDETNVKMVDDAGIAAGGVLFKSTCAACHSADGGGGVGPNLTDDYWLHGGSIKDIFKTIKYGWPDKGMKSWKDDFSPKQIAELASYVKSIKGTTPAAPKEKQGELYIESEGAETDSVSAVAVK